MLRTILYAFIGIFCVNIPVFSADEAADKVLVLKAKRKLHLLRHGRIYKTYKIRLGRQPLGHKIRQGDGRTPEGTYLIDFRNPNSAFTLSLHINYPSEKDRQAAKLRGDSPGGDIYIHGLPNGQKTFTRYFQSTDWTDGCIALSNEDIHSLWQEVKNGTAIEIRP